MERKQDYDKFYRFIHWLKAINIGLPLDDNVNQQLRRESAP
jgi:hypothetical protein